MNRADLERWSRIAANLLDGQPIPGTERREHGAVLKLLQHHRLLPLARHQLRRTQALQTIDRDWQDRMASETHATAARHRRALEVLGEALRLLEGLGPVLFKGLAAGRHWPDPSLRDPGDIDMIVPPERHREAAERLLGAGWREMPTVHGGLEEEVAARYGFARMLRHPRWPVAVDLHRWLVDWTEPFPLSGREIMATARPEALSAGVEPLVAEPARHWALLALHAVRHGSFRLHAFQDLRLAGAELSPEDNIAIYEYSKRERILRPVQVSYLAGRQLHGGSFPDLALGEPDAGTCRAAKRRTPAVLAHGHLSPRGGPRRLAALLDLMEGTRDRLRYLRRLALPPREITPAPTAAGFLRHRLRSLKRLLRSLQ
jgi:hypothetical protein